MAQLNMSGTWYATDGEHTVAYIKQIKDNTIKNYVDTLSQKEQGRVPSDIKSATGIFQQRMNEFFLRGWLDFQSFLLDEGVDPTIIDSWKEVQDFLEGLPDDEAMWLKTKLAALDNRITAMDIPDGGAYDVSADHVDGQGNYKKYASLSAAIAETEIATKDRKSGMYIRYIDSTTGKYKFYHYKLEYADTTEGNNAFEDESNWASENLDESPAENSKNLVTSGAVYDAIATSVETAQQYVDDNALKYTEQSLSSEDKTQALANLGISGIDAAPVVNSTNLVKSGGVYTAIDTAIDSVAFSTNEKVNTIGIDETPTPESSNLVTSGGVSENIKVNGSAFNISEYNAVETVPATYTDLTDALGTNGANVPSSYRTGGMSVKFILQLYTVNKTTSDEQPASGTLLETDPAIVAGTKYKSSDLNVFAPLPTTDAVVYYVSDGEETPTYTIYTISKNTVANCEYVQKRYMSTDTTNATFVNAANWQGIDTTPTAGSQNLIISGGVYEQKIIDEINNQFIALETDKIVVSEENSLSLYLNSSGKIVNNPAGNYFGYILKLKAGETYNFSYNTNYSLFDSFPIIGMNGNDYQINKQTLTIDDDSLMKFAVLTVSKTALGDYFIVVSNTLKSDVNTLKSDVGTLKELETTSIPFLINGAVISTGTFDHTLTCKRTDYIPVIKGSVIIGYDGYVNSQKTEKLVAFFDENKDFISTLDLGTKGIKTVTLTDDNIPVNAVYFIVSTTNDQLENSSVSSYLSRYTDYEFQKFKGETEQYEENNDAEVERIEDNLDDYIQENNSNLWGIYDKFSKDSNFVRVKIWIDNVPNQAKYKLRVDCPNPSIEKYRLYKGTSAHRELESYMTDLDYGVVYEITKDANKPSLYIYPSGTDTTVENDRTYTITTFDNKEESCINQRILNLENAQGSNNWDGKTIVCFGDSITEYVDADSKHWTDYLAALTNANVINVGIGGTRIAQRYNEIPVFDETGATTYPATTYVFREEEGVVKLYKFNAGQAHTGTWTGDDVTEISYETTYSFCNIDIVNMVKSSCDTDTPIADRFIKQMYAARFIYQDHSDNNIPIIERLAAINWSNVDAVIVLGGVNDWQSGYNYWGTTGSTNPRETLGALNKIVEYIGKTYPKVQLYWATPPVHWSNYPATSLHSDFGDNEVRGTKTLKEFCAMIQSEVVLNHIPVCDLYNTLGWNMNNFSFYFDGNDGTHPKNGIKYIGRKMQAFIQANKTF